MIYKLYKNSDLTGFICKSDNLLWAMDIAKKCGCSHPYLKFKDIYNEYYGFVQL